MGKDCILQEERQIVMDNPVEVFYRLWRHAENEIVEFKKAETGFDIDELGKYFSALHYRNECLCRGMFNFNMIDTVGRGIKKIYTEQRSRFFPMPDYEIDNEKRTVGVTIYGKMIDEKYTSLLKREASLSLKECIWLDAVQKHRPITKEAAKHLRGKGLIEGRHPHYMISLTVAKLTRQVGHYTKEQGLAKDALKKLALQLAHNAGKMGFKRMDAFDALQHSLPLGSSRDEKLRYIGRLLVELAHDGVISKSVTGKVWMITDKGELDLKS